MLSGQRHPAPGAARLSEWEHRDLLIVGLELTRAGKPPHLLFTVRGSPFRLGQLPEAHHYLKEVQPFGIPAAVMVCTPLVANTAEEAHPHPSVTRATVISLLADADPSGYQFFPFALRTVFVRTSGSPGAAIFGGFPGPWTLGRFTLARSHPVVDLAAGIG